MPTKQETFDIVARHLLTQGRKAQEPATTEVGPRCRYRATDGARCAVGCLLGDDVYSPEMEGGSLEAVELYPDDAGDDDRMVTDTIKALGHDFDLCLSLQRLHDYEPPSVWRVGLSNVARRFALSAAVLDEVAT